MLHPPNAAGRRWGQGGRRALSPVALIPRPLHGRGGPLHTVRRQYGRRPSPCNSVRPSPVVTPTEHGLRCGTEPVQTQHSARKGVTKLSRPLLSATRVAWRALSRPSPVDALVPKPGRPGLAEGPPHAAKRVPPYQRNNHVAYIHRDRPPSIRPSAESLDEAHLNVLSTASREPLLSRLRPFHSPLPPPSRQFQSHAKEAPPPTTLEVI